MIIKISKLCYLILILYSGWFQVVFFEIPYFLLFLGFCLVALIILHSVITGSSLVNLLTFELLFWILFAITSALFGYFIAVNKSFLFDSVITFVEYLLLIFCMLYISNNDKNVDFFMNVMILHAFLLAITTIFWGVDYGEGRIAMSANNNPNSLGINMALGITFILCKQQFHKFLYMLVSFSLIILFTYVCLLTGSRKAFLSVLLILVYWLINIAIKDSRNMQMMDNLKGVMVITVIVLISYYFLIPFFNGSILIERLSSLFEGGDSLRESMYRVAWGYFEDNPMVGIGMNNYRAVSPFGTYSHSTYAEALACTGIIGCFFYFIPYLKIWMNYIHLGKKKNIEYEILRQGKILLGLFFVLLFLGVGVIHFYDMESTIAFGILIAFYNVNSKLTDSNIENKADEKNKHINIS